MATNECMYKSNVSQHTPTPLPLTARYILFRRRPSLCLHKHTPSPIQRSGRGWLVNISVGRSLILCSMTVDSALFNFPTSTLVRYCSSASLVAATSDLLWKVRNSNRLRKIPPESIDGVRKAFACVPLWQLARVSFEMTVRTADYCTLS
jgi:hypothetical protein